MLHDIKIFYDGVDLEFIAENNNNLIKGITTNPTLMKKGGIRNYEDFSKKLIEAFPAGPISLEVFSDEFEEMKSQALQINSWGDNVYIKIPITNSKGESSKNLIKYLISEGVNLNVTAVFTLEQFKYISECFENTESNIISIFCGRIADSGINPEITAKSFIDFKTKESLNVDVLWASARELYNLVQAINTRCEIITLDKNLINKIENIGKDLEVFSLETVKMFYEDAITAGYNL